MSVAALKLRMWLNRNGISQASFAKGIGVREAVISRYLRGRRCPTIENANKIRVGTDNHILFEEWIQPYVVE